MKSESVILGGSYGANWNGFRIIGEVKAKSENGCSIEIESGPFGGQCEFVKYDDVTIQHLVQKAATNMNRRSFFGGLSGFVASICAMFGIVKPAKSSADTIRNVKIKVAIDGEYPKRNDSSPSDVSNDEFVHVIGEWYNCTQRKYLSPGQYMVFMTKTKTSNDFGNPSCRSVWLRVPEKSTDNELVHVPLTQDCLNHFRDGVFHVGRMYYIQLSGQKAERSRAYELMEKSDSGGTFKLSSSRVSGSRTSGVYGYWTGEATKPESETSFFTWADVVNGKFEPVGSRQF